MKIFSRNSLIIFLFLLWVHVRTILTSTHNLCFGAKIRKIGIPLHTPEVGFKGVFIARTCFPDVDRPLPSRTAFVFWPPGLLNNFNFGSKSSLIWAQNK